MDWWKFVVLILYGHFLDIGWCAESNAANEEKPNVRWFTDDSRDLNEQSAILHAIAVSSNNIGLISDDIFNRYPFNRLEYEPNEDYFLLHGLRVKKDKLWALIVALLPIEYTCSCQCDLAYISGQPFDLTALVNLYLSVPKQPKREFGFYAKDQPASLGNSPPTQSVPPNEGVKNPVQISNMETAEELLSNTMKDDISYSMVAPESAEMQAFYERPAIQQLNGLALNKKTNVYTLNKIIFTLEELWNLIKAECSCQHDNESKELTIEGETISLETIIVRLSESEMIVQSVEVVTEMVPMVVQVLPVHPSQPKYNSFFNTLPLSGLDYNPKTKLYVLNNKTITIKEIWTQVLESLPISECDNKAMVVIIDNVPIKLQLIINMFAKNYKSITTDVFGKPMGKLILSAQAEMELIGVLQFLPLRGLKYNRVHKMYALWREQRRKEYLPDEVMNLVNDEVPNIRQMLQEVMETHNITMTNKELLHKYMSIYQLHISDIDVYINQIHNKKHYEFYDKDRYEIKQILNVLPFNGIKVNNDTYILPDRECTKPVLFNLVEVFVRQYFAYLWDILFNNIDYVVIVGNTELRLDNIIAYFKDRPGLVLAKYSKEVQEIFNKIPLHGLSYDFTQTMYMLNGASHTAGDLFLIINSIITDYDEVQQIFKLKGTQVHLQEIVNLFLEKIITVEITQSVTEIKETVVVKKIATTNVTTISQNKTAAPGSVTMKPTTKPTTVSSKPAKRLKGKGKRTGQQRTLWERGSEGNY